MPSLKRFLEKPGPFSGKSPLTPQTIAALKLTLCEMTVERKRNRKEIGNFTGRWSSVWVRSAAELHMTKHQPS